MELKHKVIPIQVKKVDEENRTLVIVASTEDVDREGDILKADGWRLEHFKANPVIPWAHKYGEPPVAKALEAWVEAKKLMAKVQFATKEQYPFAETVWQLYKDGFLRAFSVGFLPIRWEWIERELTEGRAKIGRNFLEHELWEISACVVPSNPYALVAAREAGIDLSAVDKQVDTLAEIIIEKQDKIAAQDAEIKALVHQLELATLEEHEKAEAPPFTRDQLRRLVEEAVATVLAKAFKRRLNYYLGKV